MLSALAPLDARHAHVQYLLTYRPKSERQNPVTEEALGGDDTMYPRCQRRTLNRQEKHRRLSITRVINTGDMTRESRRLSLVRHEVE